MAEYIDRDELLKELCTVSAPTPSESWIVEKCIEKVNEHPTADVVPKSEVERLEKELADILVSEYTDVSVSMERLYRIRTEHPIYRAIKTDVAREIFEEIENGLLQITRPSYVTHVISELKKKYTENLNG